MGNTRASRKPARRAAVFLALLGVMVMSSGLALIAVASPGSAAPATVLGSQDRGGGDNCGGDHGDKSVQSRGGGDNCGGGGDNCGGDHGDRSVQSGKDDNCGGGDCGGDHGDRSVQSGKDDNCGGGDCGGDHGDRSVQSGRGEDDCTENDATADVSVTQPDCDNENTPSFAPSGDHVSWEVTDQDLSPGGFVEVTFTADKDHRFADHSKVKVITKNFDAAEICEIVNPPREVTPVEPTSSTRPVTPTRA